MSDQEQQPALSPFSKVDIPFKENYSSITNLLLVSKSVSEYNQFISSGNDTTLCIAYDTCSDFDDLLVQLSTIITSLERIAIVTHGLPTEKFQDQCVLKYFQQKELFFTSDDLLQPPVFSKGILQLKALVEAFGVTHIDFLGCNLLLYPEWKAYFEILNTFSTHPVIGASDNETGNFKFGGDWVLESTNEDVQNIYFSSLIQNYTGLLATLFQSYSGDGTTRNYTYTTEGEILDVNNFNGAMVLPTSLNGTTLTNCSMGTSMRTGISGLTSLVIPDGYVTMDNGLEPFSFWGAVNLTSVTLPNAMTFIGGGAFSNCTKLSSINIPSQIKSFGKPGSNDGVFGYSKLSSIVIPNSCTYIGSNFIVASSLLTSVTIGTGLQTLMANAFSYCNALTSVVFQGSALTYLDKNVFTSSPLIGSIVIPGSLTFVGEETFMAGFGAITSLSTININMSCDIPKSFCANRSHLLNLTIGGTPTTIGDGAISRCARLKSVSLPNSLTSTVGAWNFLNCTALQTITIPPNMKFGGSGWAFEGCSSLNTVYLPLTANSNGGMNGDANPFVSCTALTSINLYDNSGNYYKFTGTNAQAISRSNNPCILFNVSLRTLTQKALSLPALDISTNTFTVNFDVSGVTITDGRKYTSDTIKTFLNVNSNSLSNGKIVISGSSLPGFSNFVVKNTSNQIAVFNSSSTVGTQFKNVFSSSELINKVFYILQDTSGDVTTLNTFAGTPVTVTNIGTGFTIRTGSTGEAVPYATGSSFSYEGLRFALGSIFGESNNIICFKEGTKILSLKEGLEMYVPIEKLKEGDLVKTANPARPYVAVHQIGSREIENPAGRERRKDRLYSCFPSDYPSLEEELVLTGCHSILVDHLTSDEKKETLDALGDIYTTDGKYRLMTYLDKKAIPYEEEGKFTIWHVALEHEDDYMNYGIWANGLLVESCSKRMLKEYSGFSD